MNRQQLRLCASARLLARARPPAEGEPGFLYIERGECEGWVEEVGALEPSFGQRLTRAIQRALADRGALEGIGSLEVHQAMAVVDEQLEAWELEKE